MEIASPSTRELITLGKSLMWIVGPGEMDSENYPRNLAARPPAATGSCGGRRCRVLRRTRHSRACESDTNVWMPKSLSGGSCVTRAGNEADTIHSGLAVDRATT